MKYIVDWFYLANINSDLKMAFGEKFDKKDMEHTRVPMHFREEYNDIYEFFKLIDDFSWKKGQYTLVITVE